MHFMPTLDNIYIYIVMDQLNILISAEQPNFQEY